jgi:hypothetical protein
LGHNNSKNLKTEEKSNDMFAYLSSNYFSQQILTVIALALNGANLYGYIRCKLGHNPGISDATGILQQGVRVIYLCLPLKCY